MLKSICCAVLLIVLAACNPSPASITNPAPTPTLLDESAIYRQTLTTAEQNDLALIDRPTRYTLTLQYTANPPTLAGSEEVVYFNKQAQPLNEIYFRLFANYPEAGGKITVSQLTVDGVPVTPAFEVQDTALRVPLSKPLAPNTPARLRLEFKVTIPIKGTAHYADFTANDSVVTLPSIYPLIPAYDAKGWHTELPPPYGDLVYADVSFYTVTVTVPAKMLVLASGSTIDVRDNGDGTATWRIVGAPMRDFDINLTTQLQKASAVVGETTINSYFEPSDAGNGKTALQVATDALKTFQKRFGAYPYRELDVVETPTTAGGIEYPGIIVIGRRLYTDPKTQDYFDFVVAHEVAHQWWYGVVGDDQVNHPWLDEALAQYSTLVFYEDNRGAASGPSILRNVLQGPYNAAKDNGQDAAVDQPVGAFSDSNYSAIVYAKGALFFDAIRKKIGDDKFFEFLKLYYERYRFKVAFPEDMLKVAQDACGCSLQAEYQQWIMSPSK